ncbi:type 1 glutamine amidotransferase domain-containing protein [Nocardia sp. NPDC056952]|uniref:type 1 glutamine amidotransferase domain-containing protein n=1 Tax=Nocardia sp. NPDC056952 TaxID=3345979 RepID=UPI0036258250
MTKVLFVLSAADRWSLTDGSVYLSGFWAEEVVVPHRTFAEAGWEIVFATPGGRAPTLDQRSIPTAGSAKARRGSSQIVEQFLDIAAQRYLARLSDELTFPLALKTVVSDTFDLIFYPGGHGPMEDLAYDEVSGVLLAERLESGRPLALLSHAPAAVLAVPSPHGVSPFGGYRMTAVSNREELLNRFAKKAPWLLEDRLRALGVDYIRGRYPLRSHVVVDRNVYTGQNTRSAQELAERLVADIGARSRV